MKAFPVFLLMFALPVLAQEHEHNSDVIKGSEHPEQISDADAYREFFLGTDLAAILQRMMRGTKDGAAAEKILSSFRAQWDNRVAVYNAKASALNKDGKRADLKQFVAERDAFVEQTRKQLAQELSPQSMAEIETGVQGIKQFMSASSERPDNNDPCVAYSNSFVTAWIVGMGNAEPPNPNNPESLSKAPIIVTVGTNVDGASIMTINSKACGQSAPDISAVTHTAQLSLGADKESSSRKAPAFCADCYISASSKETFYNGAVGKQMRIGSEVVIHCSYGGDIF